MFTIGIDPHKGSHVAAVLDHREELLCESYGSARIVRNGIGCWRSRRRMRRGCGRSKAREGSARCWRSSSSPRVNTLFDVPAKLSARVRVLDNECADKNDTHDARSAAIVALRNRQVCAR